MARPLDPGVEQTDLPNGLRIVTETMPEARSVTLGAWVRVGGRDEPAVAQHVLASSRYGMQNTLSPTGQ